MPVPLPDALVITCATMTLAIAVFGALSLIGDPVQRRVGWGLALFLGVAAFDTLIVLIGAWDATAELHAVARLEPLVTFLYGPAIYLYVLSVTGKPPGPRRAAIILAAPLLLALPLYAVAASLPRDMQVAMLSGTDLSGLGLSRRAILLMTLTQVAFVLVTFCFLVACWRALDDNLRRLRTLFSSIEDRTLNWLRIVMILIGLAWAQAAFHGTLESMSPQGKWQELVDTVITLTWVTMLAYFGLRQSPALQEPALPQPPVEPGKYVNSALDSERMQQLAARIQRLMAQDKLHRDPSLSLRRLADRVGASPNYVSQTLNDHLGTSFFDFVNGYRVEEAANLLRSTDRTVTDIALDVGFNSRSTFNAAVRKHRGASPTELRHG